MVEERKRASKSEEKCARNALRAHKRKARKARTHFQSKLKFERGFVSDFRYVVLRARDIKMTSSKKSESSAKKSESSAKTFVVAITCALLCSPFAIEGTSATENNNRSPYGVTHSSSSTSDDARLLEVPPRPPPGKKGEEQQTALGAGNKKPTLTAKDVESYSSSGAWLERATEMERSKAPHSGEKEEDAKLRPSSASASSASTSSSHNDWDWIAERYAHVHKLYTGKKKHEAKVAEKKLQEQLEKEEEETKKKFFVGKPKLVDGRYQHVSKSRSKGSFAYEHGEKDKNRQSAIVSATREGNKHGLHHHNWQQYLCFDMRVKKSWQQTFLSVLNY